MRGKQDDYNRVDNSTAGHAGVETRVHRQAVTRRGSPPSGDPVKRHETVPQHQAEVAGDQQAENPQNGPKPHVEEQDHAAASGGRHLGGGEPGDSPGGVNPGHHRIGFGTTAVQVSRGEPEVQGRQGEEFALAALEFMDGDTMPAGSLLTQIAGDQPEEFTLVEIGFWHCIGAYAMVG